MMSQVTSGDDPVRSQLMSEVARSSVMTQVRSDVVSSYVAISDNLEWLCSRWAYTIFAAM